jgi:DNA (cytosine-5)-methyltransferase 1
MAETLFDIHLSDFPEKISVKDTSGGKVQIYMYGQKSYDNQLAVITHYLHNNKKEKNSTFVKQAHKYLKEYLEYKFPQCEITKDILCDPLQVGLFSDIYEIPFPDPENYKFTFIDLFAGMGGFRLAMQAQGGKCVFSSEWNQFAQKTYMANFGEMPFGDITKEETKKYIPKKFDVLCAGFPCQPFSIAGVSKKKSLGRETGFRDKTQGTLFFDVADILNRHRPKAFYLENVKNLVSHDKGNTFKVILSTLEELEYSVHYKIMDGKNYVPQHRERIMIVGFDKRRYKGLEKFEFPKAENPTKKIRDILEECPDSKYTLSDKLWNYLQDYAERHKAKGNGFGFGMTDPDGISRTLSARYYKDGSEILIPQGEGKNPRRLTPRECARLMGYPDNYIINRVSDLQAYRQCGNSVVVPLITAVSEQLIKVIINK